MRKPWNGRAPREKKSLFLRRGPRTGIWILIIRSRPSRVISSIAGSSLVSTRWLSQKENGLSDNCEKADEFLEDPDIQFDWKERSSRDFAGPWSAFEMTVTSKFSVGYAVRVAWNIIWRPFSPIRASNNGPNNCQKRVVVWDEKVRPFCLNGTRYCQMALGPRWLLMHEIGVLNIYNSFQSRFHDSTPTLGTLAER